MTPRKNKAMQKPSDFIKPFPLAFTAALVWAMLHQPAGFQIFTTTSWGLQAMAVGMAARAILALLLSGLPLCAALLRRAHLRTRQDAQ